LALKKSKKKGLEYHNPVETSGGEKSPFLGVKEG